MGRLMNYITKLDIYPYSGNIAYGINDLTVNYVVPVWPNSKYTVTMTEIGNRLRAVFTTINPLLTTSDISGCIDIVMNPEFDVGYQFSYTPSSHGYIVVYVSNAGEHPAINIETDGAGGDSFYDTSVFCIDASSATSLTGSIYARKGDWVFCTLTTRSDTTLPEGWEVLHVSQTTTSSTQHMTMLCKKIEADGKVDFTVSQANAARIYINLIAFTGIGGFRYTKGSESLFDSDSCSSFEVERPEYSLILWCLSANLWSSGAWSCGSIPSAVINNQRQANFIENAPGTTRVFTPIASGTSAIIDYVIVLPKDYAPTGSVEFSTTLIRSVDDIVGCKIFWDEIVPDGTSIEVYARLSGGEYESVRSGMFVQNITSGLDVSEETLYILVQMGTEDLTVTPTLSNLLVRFLGEGDSHILTLDFNAGNIQSFQNAVGGITIDYADGTLAGVGGPIEAFSISFEPVDLKSKNHPHTEEHVELGTSAYGSLTKVYYSDSMSIEHVDASVSATGILVHINDL